MNDDEKALWEKFAETKSVAVRNELVKRYVNLIRFVSERIFYSSAVVSKDDMMNVGIIGLIDAIEKFDLSKNVKFITYAYLRVYGSIMDYIRGSEWTPRSVREKMVKLERTYKSLAERSIHNPTDEQMAAEMKLSLKGYHKLVDGMYINQVFSLDEFFNAEDTTSAGKVLDTQELSENKELVASIIENRLEEKEKTLLSLYYYEECTLKEIAGVLNLTEARISQIHTQAIAKIKAQLAIAKSVNVY